MHRIAVCHDIVVLWAHILWCGLYCEVISTQPYMSRFFIQTKTRSSWHTLHWLRYCCHTWLWLAELKICTAAHPQTERWRQEAERFTHVTAPQTTCTNKLSCSSGGRAASLLIKRSVVWSPTPQVCTLTCPWARYWALNDSWWLLGYCLNVSGFLMSRLALCKGATLSLVRECVWTGECWLVKALWGV